MGQCYCYTVLYKVSNHVMVSLPVRGPATTLRPVEYDEYNTAITIRPTEKDKATRGPWKRTNKTQ